MRRPGWQPVRLSLLTPALGDTLTFDQLCLFSALWCVALMAFNSSAERHSKNASQRVQAMIAPGIFFSIF